MYDRYGLFIDGIWRPGENGDRTPVINPVNGEALGESSVASKADADAAIAAAEKGLGVWRSISAWERADRLTRFSTADDAYARANASDLGLSAYVFTRDPARAREAVASIEAGMVGVNSFALAAAEAPFGGVKSSGMGREGGAEGVLDYSNVKLAQMAV